MPWYSLYIAPEKKLANFQVWENGERVHLLVQKSQIRNFFEKYSKLRYEERNPTFQMLSSRNKEMEVPLFFRLDFTILMEQCRSEEQYNTVVYETMQVFLVTLHQQIFDQASKYFTDMIVLDHSKARVMIFFPNAKLKQGLLQIIWRNCLIFLTFQASHLLPPSIQVDWRKIITHDYQNGMKLRLPYCKSDTKISDIQDRQDYYAKHHIPKSCVEDYFHYHVKEPSSMPEEELIKLLYSTCIYDIE